MDLFSEGLKYLDQNDVENYNPKKGYEYFSKLEKEGYVYAKLYLGILCFDGIGIERDRDKANKYFDEMRALGNPRINSLIEDCIQDRLRKDRHFKLDELSRRIIAEANMNKR